MDDKTEEKSDSTRLCPNCKKQIPVDSFSLHFLHCFIAFRAYSTKRQSRVLDYPEEREVDTYAQGY
jgi:hypothetical protein